MQIDGRHAASQRLFSKFKIIVHLLVQVLCFVRHDYVISLTDNKVINHVLPLSAIVHLISRANAVVFGHAPIMQIRLPRACLAAP